MIAYAIILASLLALWHFVWDGVLAPSLRVECRFKLFTLRDRLRGMKHRGEIDDERFFILEDSINTAIQFLSSFSLSSFRDSSRTIENDPELKQLIERRLAFVRESPNEEIPRILSGVAATAYIALAINSGGWFPLTVPLAAVLSPIQALLSWVNRLIALTEQEIQNSNLLKYPVTPKELAL